MKKLFLRSNLVYGLCLFSAAVACKGGSDSGAGAGDGDGDGDGTGDGDGDSGGSGSGGGTMAMGGFPPLDVGDGWPEEPNDYSWDGSFTPTAELEGLYDDIYFDGHDVDGQPSPLLPPGEWDWQETALLANWNNFSQAVGDFELLSDAEGLAFGWRLNRTDEEGVDADAVMEFFHGSSGTDIIDLGRAGSFSSTGNPLFGDPVGLGDGPDMLRYLSGYSAGMRLGSSLTGSENDNDLAILGSPGSAAVDTYDIITTTVHTGPGSDLVFVNNFERAAIDLGNGNDGSTDAIDPQDGADMVVIGGNARDFRAYGGRGNDTFVWYVDEVKHSPGLWLGPNFFGSGGWGDALWDDEGVDRLVLGIPEDTPIVTSPGDIVPGSVLIMIEGDYEVVIDTPTEHDPYARYYVYVPPSSSDQRTITLQYLSADETVDTAYFYITAIEELQFGTSDSAPVYRLDDIEGTYELDSDLEPTSPVPSRDQYEGLMESFLR